MVLNSLDSKILLIVGREEEEDRGRLYAFNLIDSKYLDEILYLDVFILRFLEARSCWTAFAIFLSFDATTIAK